ncbi:YugN-like family protein [Bacillus testis]|uniref:YugN-like family protein n=1 Tax=Bacillus testis TaxID=1622072 RepID=UPI00067ED102|nr:YugN-like family protein [Bacillus testis]
MIEIPTRLTGKTFALASLETCLRALGYTLGGNWEYDHGYFDYKIADLPGYTFLRLPIYAYQCDLDEKGASVRLGTPFILAHQYQPGIDGSYSKPSTLTAVFNQFAEPIEKDATVQDEYVILGKALVQELERLLL